MPRPRPRHRFRPALLRIVAITAVCLLGALATAGWYSARVPSAPRLYTAPIIPPAIPPTTHTEPLTARVPEASEPPVSAKSVPAEPKAHADAPAPAEPQPTQPAVAELAFRELAAPRPPEATPAEPPALTLSAAPALPALPAPHAAAPKIHHSHATAAQLEQRVAPQYPPLALSRRIAGQVTLSVLIRKDGSVTDVKVLSGNPLFHISAVDAVKQWRYTPATLDGEPVEARAQVVLKFDLPGRH